MDTFLSHAQQIKEELLEIRRTIHHCPEVGTSLPRTKAYVAEKLREFGYAPKEICESGIVAVLQGAKLGKTMLLRADMDALKIAEKTNLPFAAENGCMHACGHDLHTAMLLGAAKLLKAHQQDISGNVKFVFQPNEEGFQGAKAMVKAAYEYVGPVYIRFGRAAVPVFHEEEGYSFEIGKGEVLQDGTDVAIIANGLMVAEAIEAGKVLAEAGISARVINMATIKPLDEELVLKAAQDCGKIITCEEHNIIGGLGEAVCGLLSEKCPTPVRRIGVNDEFGHSGPAGALLKQFGLSAEHIVEVAKEFCGK